MPSGTLAIINDPTFTAMLEQATPHLRTFARRLCGNAADADDVLQESLAKAWRHRQSFQPERDSNLDADQPGRAWLQRLTFRVFCDFRTRPF